MENLKIIKFLDIGDGYGDGYGDGSGYGSGSGTGDGSGYGTCSGFGYGDGDGSGSGSGDGSGSGSGFGYGDGDGYGDGSGSGSGYGSGDGDGSGSGSGDSSGSGSGFGSGYGTCSGSGYGSGLKSLDNINIYNIDGLSTGITTAKNNIAKGFIVNKDLSTQKCYVVKQNNIFAHGETLKQAYEYLFEKLFKELTEEERIEEFTKVFTQDIKYPAKMFFDWHNKLTGSCLMGREQFVKDNNIDLDKDMFTVEEFVKLTQNSYGGGIVKRLLK
jgi:hypothetical protein